MDGRQAEERSGRDVLSKRPAVIIATLTAVFLCALALNSGVGTSDFSGYEADELEISAELDTPHSGSKLKQVENMKSYNSIPFW